MKILINYPFSFIDVLADGCIKKGSFCPTQKILKSENIGNEIKESKDFSTVSGSVVQLKPQKVELNLIPKYEQKVDFDVSVSQAFYYYTFLIALFAQCVARWGLGGL